MGLIKRLLSLPAYLPLCLIHALGGILGWLTFLSSRRYARRMEDNLAASGLCGDARACRRLLRRAVAEAGKSVTELLPIWLRPQRRVLRLMRGCRGWEHVEAALERGRGIVFLTPHQGCFEIASLYYAARHPITVLYRPPRLRWLEPLMQAGRVRGQVSLAPTSLKGVKALLAALKRGEAVGVLPDQVPNRGEGVWADFFGRPAYTMTLVGSLHQATGAAVLLAFAERLPWGRGYRLWLEPMPGALSGDKQGDAALLNRAVEELVRRCPGQYLWSYNRYKVPRGVEPPTGPPPGPPPT